MYRFNQGIGGNGGGAGFNPDDNPCLTLYNDFVNSTPAVTRLSVMGLVFTWMFSWFFPLDNMLGNITYFTFGYFEVYRILLSPLVGNSFISILMMMFFYPTMGTRMEHGLGSAGFLYLLTMFSFTINIVFNLFCLILYAVGMREILRFNCCGFFNVIFALLTVECQRNPEAPRMILCCPYPIPSKYFPFVFFLIFSLLGGPQLDLAVGIMVGIWYANGTLDFMNPSNSWLGQLESGWLHSLTQMSLWIPTSAAVGYQGYEPTTYYDGGGNSIFAMPSTSSSSGLSAPRFPGYGNVTGVTPSSQAVPVAEVFPGSANRVGSASTSSYPTATAVSSLPQLGTVSSPSLPTFSGDGGGSESKPSREELAAKRLSALSRGTASSSNEGGSGNVSNV